MRIKWQVPNTVPAQSPSAAAVNCCCCLYDHPLVSLTRCKLFMKTASCKLGSLPSPGPRVLLFPHETCSRNQTKWHVLRHVLFPAERRGEAAAHPPAHGRGADRPRQGRGAGFCAVGRAHQRICFSGQSSQAFPGEPHLCNVPPFSAVFLLWRLPPCLRSFVDCEQYHAVRLASAGRCGGTTIGCLFILWA